jgi:predicted nucleic acid-binding protein
MILADTSAWIDYLRGTGTEAATALDKVLTDGRVVLGDLILAEIMRGVTADSEWRRVWSLLKPLRCVVLGGRDIAIIAGRNNRILRMKGVTMRGTIDLLIATWCIENGIALIHRDRDFDGMERHLGLIRYQ